MFSRAVVLTRIGGIEVRLDPSLLLFAVLVAFSLVTRFSDHGTATAIAMTAVGGLLFFASVLAHELGHALEARHRGMVVHGVTLFLLGGVTEMHAEEQTPRDELAVAAVGPWVSLVCGAVFGIIATFAGDLLPAAAAGPVASLAGLLGWLNVVLAVFNLVPGAPLDGGRILRALLWWLLGNRRLALMIAVRVGQVMAIAIVGYAVWGFVRSPSQFVPAGLIAIVGVFMFQAARSELRTSELDALFEAWTIEALVQDVAPPLPEHRLDPGDGLAETFADLPTIDVRENLHELIDRFQGRHRNVVLIRNGEPVRVVTETEIAAAVSRLRSERRLPPPAGTGGATAHGDVEVSP